MNLKFDSDKEKYCCSCRMCSVLEDVHRIAGQPIMSLCIDAADRADCPVVHSRRALVDPDSND